MIVYSPGYHIDIGVHVFPTLKYQRIYERLRARSPRARIIEPAPASWDDLARVHTPGYLRKAQTGTFSLGELAQLEVPWSPDVVEGFRLMTGGTIVAATEALAGREPRTVFHVGGGFHHAFADHGEGFCFFNDVAVAIRVLSGRGAIARAAVIDLDVHHGNGTAFIFDGTAEVFTFSMHQEHNYPAEKPRGSLDIGLPDGTGDATYLERLGTALPAVFASAPDLVFYLAGADPYEDDQLGGLALSKAGLRARDKLVLQACRDARVAVVVLLAGGYARRLDDTVDIHVATAAEAGVV